MASKLSQEAFCALLLRSGLISDERLAALRAEFRKQRPQRSSTSPRDLTEFLIRRGELTLWQAQKLLQRKHKGFLLGKYKLLSLLGRGGMSSVYLAEHLVMRRQCAIKVLPFQHVDNPAALDRFYREAQAVAALDDPNIVRAYDVDHVTEGGAEIHFLVMEYVQGRSLQQVVDDDGPLPIAEAVDYVRQAASGLTHAHAAGMVHRDVKPSNLLLDDSGTIKLLDLGLARVFENAAEQSSVTLEHHQTILGTADFLSPEQAVDSHSADHRADLYSLGCTLYFLLTGRPPFPDGSLAQRLLAHQTKSPDPIRTTRPEVPDSLGRLIDRMMAKRPDDRFPTAEALLKALSTWLDENGVTPTQPRSINPHSAEGARAMDAVRDGKQSGTRRQAVVPTNPVDESESKLRSFLESLGASNDGETLVRSHASAETIITNSRRRLSKSSKRKHPAAASRESEPGPAGDSSGSFVIDHPAIGAQRTSRTSAFWMSSPLWTARAFWTDLWSGRSQSAVLLRAVASSLLACFVFGAFLWWAEGRASRRSTPAGPATVSPQTDEAGAAAPRRRVPQIAPDADITVGPGGDFSTIDAALDYVRETFHPRDSHDVRTIRVAGGRTYGERIVIDNAQFSTFPKGVRVVCEDPQPAVLQPIGSGPVIDLTNVERFQLQGFTIRGSGQPTLVRLAGYVVSTQLERLIIEGVQETALRGVAVNGFAAGDRLILRDITIRDPRARSVAMQFQSVSGRTKDVLIHRCLILDGFESGIEFSGEVSGIEISRCIFDGANTGVGFQAASGLWEQIVVSNCTFRRFDRGLRFDRPPTSADGPFHVTKNLFAEVSGPECVIARGGATNRDLARQFTSSWNWTERALPDEPQAGEVDLFQSDGQRGAVVQFVSTDPADRSAFLQPNNREWQDASVRIRHVPRYIGAVALVAD